MHGRDVNLFQRKVKVKYIIIRIDIVLQLLHIAIHITYDSYCKIS